jgi:penicillin-binding protein 1A
MLQSSWLKTVVKVVSAISLCIAIIMSIGLFVFIRYGQDLPRYDHLIDYEPPMMSRLYTSDAQLLQEYATERRLFVPFHQIPDLVKKAFMAAEDRNFYYHFGIDVVGTFRAFLTNTLSNSWGNRPSGASTITQQVAKNFLVGNERSFERKIKEAILAMRLEYTLPKDRIFELYLNQIYMGAGTYGVAAAALVYFDKELDELTIDEAAFLAALPKAPTTLTKTEDVSRAKARRDWVIDRMIQEDMISLDEAEEAKSQPLSFKKYREKPVKADYFTDAVRRDIGQKIGDVSIKQGGLTVRTTMDVELQEQAEKSLKKGLIAYDRKHGWRGAFSKLESGVMQDKKLWQDALRKTQKPAGSTGWEHVVVLNVDASQAKIGFSNGAIGYLPLSECGWAAPCLTGQRLGTSPTRMSDVVGVGDVILVSQVDSDRFRLEQIPNVTGALVAMDPKTGRILALVGGYDFEMNQYNCALQALRQSGSCFKPFVYLVALESGLTPETKILDAPIRISLGRNGYYSPQNYSRNYLGLCSMRTGLEQSRNVMTIRLAQRVGMKKIIDCAQQFGIADHMPKQLAMVLGAGETTVLKLTAAYAVLANGGYKVTPTTVDWVQDRYGETIYRPTQDKPVLVSPLSVAQLTDMLIGVTQRGTAKSLATLGFIVAGKTGSTNNYNDAWFIGYTPDLVVGVFVGFPRPRTLGQHETGGRVATPIFRDFMESVYRDREKPQFYLNQQLLEIDSDIVNDDIVIAEQMVEQSQEEDDSLGGLQEITDIIDG